MDAAHRPADAEVPLGLATRFVLKLFVFGTLISLVPLLFVNLPLQMLLISLGSTVYLVGIVGANIAALVLSFALAAKLIFAWGVAGQRFRTIATEDNWSASER